jgi:GNAT superfamily N-acetyltransferase
MIVREAELADALAIAHVHVDSWRTTYRGIVPDDYLAGLSYDRRAATWANILGDRAGVSFVYVAEDDGGAVVGFVSGGPIRDAIPDYDGELYAIYLLEPFHRRDIGRQLVAAAAGPLLREGVRSVAVWVLAENPSRAFYEALGGRAVAEKPVEIGGVPLREIAYGWADVNELLARARS